MAMHNNPKISSTGLIFLLDTYDISNGITLLGCGGFAGSTQGVKNVLTGESMLYGGGARLSNRTYYTAFGISYNESVNGGDAAGCYGLYVGYNVRGGSIVYGTSRAIHLWVWNNDTSSWIVDSYFHGIRLAGHCYDNYSGAETGWTNEVGYFIADYNTIKATFPNCTYIVVGSHASSNFTQPLLDIMKDLGAPSLVDGWISNDNWRQFVLVGEPRLGTGNSFGWSYNNYSYPEMTGAAAHLNFGLPIKSKGMLQFDGAGSYLSGSASVGNMGTEDWTISFWWKSTGENSAYASIIEQGFTGSPSEGAWAFKVKSDTDVINFSYFTTGIVDNLTTKNPNDGLWHNIVATRSNTNLLIYSDIVLLTTITLPSNFSFGTGETTYIGYNPRDSAYINGYLPILKIYSVALSNSEITHDFNSMKSRFL